VSTSRNVTCPCGSGKKFKRCCATVETVPTPPPMVDPRALERGLAHFKRLLQGKQFQNLKEANAFLQGSMAQGRQIPPQPPGSDLERAQDLMYEAWDTEGPERARMAREALKLTPDCADAYVLLAEEERELDKALELYAQGVAAGERALGKAALKRDVGHFWGIIETRPYMRARQGLARCLWEEGRRDMAIGHYFEMLKLNPNDNQGVRYVLMSCLLDTGDPARLDELIARYPDDWSSSWLFGRALHAFRNEGDTSESRKWRRDAKKGNKHVVPYLTGKKKLPKESPEYITMGGEDEAVACAQDLIDAWRGTPGALEWLQG
jgi:tetratricopeptide (TPR) repeat protein